MSESRSFVECIQKASPPKKYDLMLKSLKFADALDLSTLSKEHPTLIKRGREPLVSYSIYACDQEGKWAIKELAKEKLSKKELMRLDKVNFAKSSIPADKSQNNPILFSVVSKYHTESNKAILIDALASQTPFDGAKYDGPMKKMRDIHLSLIVPQLRDRLPPANEEQRKKLIKDIHDVYKVYAKHIKDELVGAFPNEKDRLQLINERKARNSAGLENKTDNEVFNLIINDAVKNYCVNLIKTDLKKDYLLDKLTETFLIDATTYLDNDSPFAFDNLYKTRLSDPNSKLSDDVMYMQMVNEDYFKKTLKEKNPLTGNNETMRTVLQEKLKGKDIKEEVKSEVASLETQIEKNQKTLRYIESTPEKLQKIDAEIERREKQKNELYAEYETLKAKNPDVLTKVKGIKKEIFLPPPIVSGKKSQHDSVVAWIEKLKKEKEEINTNLAKVEGSTLDEKISNCKMKIQDAQNQINLLPKVTEKFSDIVKGSKLSNITKLISSKFDNFSSDFKFNNFKSSFFSPKRDSLKANKSAELTQENPQNRERRNSSISKK